MTENAPLRGTRGDVRGGQAVPPVPTEPGGAPEDQLGRDKAPNYPFLTCPIWIPPPFAQALRGLALYRPNRGVHHQHKGISCVKLHPSPGAAWWPLARQRGRSIDSGVPSKRPPHTLVHSGPLKPHRTDKGEEGKEREAYLRCSRVSAPPRRPFLTVPVPCYTAKGKWGPGVQTPYRSRTRGLPEGN